MVNEMNRNVSDMESFRTSIDLNQFIFTQSHKHGEPHFVRTQIHIYFKYIY